MNATDDLLSIFNAITPDNIRGVDAINDVIKVFSETVLEKYPINIDVHNIFDDNDFREDFLKTYNAVLYNTLYNLGNNVKFFVENEKYLNVINQNVLNLNLLHNPKELLTKEHITAFRDLFKKKGLEETIKYFYNWLENYYNDVNSSSTPFTITKFQRDGLDVPFILNYEGNMSKIIFDNLVRVMTHPLGFLYIYTQVFTMGLEDHYCAKDSLIYNRLEYQERNKSTNIMDKRIDLLYELDSNLERVEDVVVDIYSNPAEFNSLSLEEKRNITRIDEYGEIFVTEKYVPVNIRQHIGGQPTFQLTKVGSSYTISGSTYPNNIVHIHTTNFSVSVEANGVGDFIFNGIALGNKTHYIISENQNGYYSHPLRFNANYDVHEIRFVDVDNDGLKTKIVGSTRSGYIVELLDLDSNVISSVTSNIKTVEDEYNFEILIDKIPNGNCYILRSYTEIAGVKTKYSRITHVVGGEHPIVHTPFGGNLLGIEKYSSDSSYTTFYNLSNDRSMSLTTYKKSNISEFRYFDEKGEILYKSGSEYVQPTIISDFSVSPRKFRCVNDSNLEFKEFVFWDEIYPELEETSVELIDFADTMGKHKPIILDYHHKPLNSIFTYNNDITGYPVTSDYVCDVNSPMNGYIENGIFEGYNAERLRLPNEKCCSPYLKLDNFKRDKSNYNNAFQNRNYPSVDDIFWYSVPSTSVEDWEKFYPVTEKWLFVGEPCEVISEELQIETPMTLNYPWLENSEYVYNTEYFGMWWQSCHNWKFIGQNFVHSSDANNPTIPTQIGESLKIGRGVRRFKDLPIITKNKWMTIGQPNIHIGENNIIVGDLSEVWMTIGQSNIYIGVNNIIIGGFTSPFRGFPGFYREEYWEGHPYYHAHLGVPWYIGDDNEITEECLLVNISNSFEYYQPTLKTTYSNFAQDEKDSYVEYKQAIRNGYGVYDETNYSDENVVCGEIKQDIYHFELPKRRISSVTGDDYRESFTFYHAIPPRQQEFNNLYFEPRTDNVDPVNLQYYTVEYFDIEVVRD